MSDIYEHLIDYSSLPLTQQGRELCRVIGELKASYKAMGLPDPSIDVFKLNSLCADILNELKYTTNGHGRFIRVTLDQV